MKINAINTKKKTKVVLNCQKSLPKNEQVRFVLTPLSARKFFEFMPEEDGGIKGEKSGVTQKDIYLFYDCLGCALVGWENLKDEEGKEIKFVAGDSGGASRETVDFLPMEVIGMLFEEIIKMSKLTKNEIKN